MHRIGCLPVVSARGWFADDLIAAFRRCVVPAAAVEAILRILDERVVAAVSTCRWKPST